MAVVRQFRATLGDDDLEGFEIGDVFVDDWFVDDFLKVLCGLKFGRVGREKKKPDSVGNCQIGFAMPTGVVEDENDDAISTCSGFCGEGRQQGFKERIRDAVGNVPEAFAGLG